MQIFFILTFIENSKNYIKVNYCTIKENKKNLRKKNIKNPNSPLIKPKCIKKNNYNLNKLLSCHYIYLSFICKIIPVKNNAEAQ